MEDFIVHHDLILVNRGTTATFDSGRATSIIDITLCTSSMVPRLSDWMVLEKHEFSDHNRIRFSLAVEPPVRKRTWVLKLADWSEFKSILRSTSGRCKKPYFWTPDTVDREVFHLYKDIESALSKVCPKIRAGQKYTNKWWTADLTSQRRKTRRLQKKAKDNPGDMSLWEEYKRARNDLVSSIRKAKRTCWRNFTEEASSPESMTKLTKALFKKGGKTIGHLRRADGTSTCNKEEILDTLLDAFFPDSKEVGDDPSPPSKLFADCNEIDNIFSWEKVGLAFRSFKTRKAPGPDKIRPEVLQNLDNDTLRRVSRIYGACLCLGYVPKRWREAKVVLIPKEGKRDYSNPRAFRPISLTSFLFKGNGESGLLVPGGGWCGGQTVPTSARLQEKPQHRNGAVGSRGHN